MTLHAFILIPCSCQHTPPEHGGGELKLKSFQTLFPRIQGLSCLLDSHLSQARSDVWVVVGVKLYNLFHQVWGGMKPQFTKLSPSYAALQKHQLLYLNLERTAAGGAENRLEASSHLQRQLRSCYTCQRCEGEVFSSKWHQGIERFAATVLQADF